MRNKGSTNTVFYDGAKFELPDDAYAEWEDKQKSLSKVAGLSGSEKELAEEWITYYALIHEGHFVSKPPEDEPTIAKVLEAPPMPAVRYPEYDNWDREKILNEREKLLKAQERWLRQEQDHFEIQKMTADDGEFQFYHKDGTPYEKTDYSNKLTVCFIIIIILFLAAICGRH